MSLVHTTSSSAPDLETLEDAQLIRAAANGQRRALAALYDRHAPSMLALALRVLAQRQEAEDLVHDVFLEAWKRAADYDANRGSVRAWLLLRTRSRALDRKKSVRVKRSVSLESESLPETGRRGADTAPDQARLRQVLLELPSEQREVLVLGYFEGLSSTEISSHMGIPIGTVKSRVAAALAKLRGVLKEGDSAVVAIPNHRGKP
ncbi:MAG: sigma-70 family RNA polymerase sigma factor [Polyangiaceae bacterium]